MTDVLIANFCELFGFNREEHPVCRLPIKIGSEIFPTGHVFPTGTLVGGFDISNHIDEQALVYFDNHSNIVLHMFVQEGTAKKRFVNTQPEKVIYRFSSIKHLQPAYEKGDFLISSAIEYIKKEYDQARKDNELMHSRDLKPEKVKISLIKNNQNISPLSYITFSSVLPIGCFILCFSYVYDESFYEKFKGSDSCLIIKDPVAFEKRIHRAFKKKMPDFYGVNARVTYSKHISPYGVLFSKQNCYLWQKEYRFAWQPLNPQRQLHVLDILNYEDEKLKALIPEPVKISLGSLEDIAILIKKPTE